jgi:hypothetical protein
MLMGEKLFSKTGAVFTGPKVHRTTRTAATAATAGASGAALLPSRLFRSAIGLYFFSTSESIFRNYGLFFR